MCGFFLKVFMLLFRERVRRRAANEIPLDVLIDTLSRPAKAFVSLSSPIESSSAY